MASDIRISIGFFSHLKTKRLTLSCGHEGVLCLLKLWSYTAENKPNGNLGNVSDDDLEIICDWTGEQNQLAKKLFELNFVERDKKQNLIIHDWEIWQPWVVGAERRSDYARKAAQLRWDKKLSGAYNPDAQPNADGMPGACGAHADSIAIAMPLSFPFLSFPIPTKEYKKYAPSDGKSYRSKRKVMTWEEYLDYVNSESKKYYDSNIDLWCEAYPAINVREECKAALAWLRTNPNNRKEKIGSFFTKWLKNAQERAKRSI